MISGNLNFLEASGPLQAFNGTALPFTFFVKKKTSMANWWNDTDRKKQKYPERNLYYCCFVLHKFAHQNLIIFKD